MEDVAADGARRGDAFQGQLDALAEAVVVFLDLGDRRDGGRVARGHHQALYLEQGTEVVKVVAAGESEHHRPAAVVDALAEDHLAVGAFLGEFVEGFRLQFQECRDLVLLIRRPQADHVRLALGEDLLEVEGLDDVRRRQAGEVDGAGQCGHAEAPKRSGTCRLSDSLVSTRVPSSSRVTLLGSAPR
ncbi:hypothetical protein FQZ97_826350 [compost metagenome]